MSQQYDLLVKNVRVVRPNQDSVETKDVAIKDGKFAKIADNIAAEEAARDL